MTSQRFNAATKSGLNHACCSWEDKVYDSVRDGEEETIAESGRLYVRNLAYCCTEDDLQACFSKYGQSVSCQLVGQSVR